MFGAEQRAEGVGVERILPASPPPSSHALLSKAPPLTGARGAAPQPEANSACAIFTNSAWPKRASPCREGHCCTLPSPRLAANHLFQCTEGPTSPGVLRYSRSALLWQLRGAKQLQAEEKQSFGVQGAAPHAFQDSVQPQGAAVAKSKVLRVQHC